MTDTLLNRPVAEFPIAILLVADEADRELVFKLRHDSFAASGWIEARPNGRFRDRFDDLPSTAILSAVHDGRTIATLRVAVSLSRQGPAAMPCAEVFPEEIRALRVSGHVRLAEFSRVAIDPAISNTSFKTTLYGSLVRSALLIAQAAEIDFGLAAVHSRLSAFYRHMIGFRQLAIAESYGVIAEPTHLLGCEGRLLFRRGGERSRFFHLAQDEIEHARRVLAIHRPELPVSRQVRKSL